MKQSDEKLQKKWEKRLKKAGLAIAQPMTDNSEGEMAQVEHFPSHKGATDLDFNKLRQRIDGSEGFMEGHQIMEVRSIDREIPEWVYSNKEVQRVILTSFPKKDVNPRQKAKAGIWARVITLYYRMELPMQVVARELGVDKTLIKRWLQSINRAEKGLANRNGKPRRVTPPTPCEGTTEGRHETIEGTFLHHSGTDSESTNGTSQAKMQMPQGGRVRGGERDG